MLRVLNNPLLGDQMKWPLAKVVSTLLFDHSQNVDARKSLVCAKINPIKRIEAIKVAGLDFKLTYNEKYNMLTDEYSVSLRKVLIPIDDLLP